VRAWLLADVAHPIGLMADLVTLTTHKVLRGPRGGAGREDRPGGVPVRPGRAAGIALNRNVIPYDPEPAAVTSGTRVGTPCVTSQGMGPGR
jgi:glycine/serine hydroxymethyltransferase